MRRHASASYIAFFGAACLAAALGIGRFAFTPLLPFMQAEGLLTLKTATYLAGTNYLGYLIGALLCVAWPPDPAKAVRYGLFVVAVSTIAMATTNALPLWLAARMAAGAASAFVLVGVSALALKALAARSRPGLAGAVFSGVGVGIVLAGLAALATGAAAFPIWTGWALLGLLALLPLILSVPQGVVGAAPLFLVGTPSRFSGEEWRLILCYGVFGFAYIIPATYLPAVARLLVDDPMVFGWAWPLFGAAAAICTLAGGAVSRAAGPRACWIAGHLIMALGLIWPVLWPNLAAIVASAVCVGGTFMLITMCGMQEAQRLSGHRAPRLMAGMTAAFAACQFAGPLLMLGETSAAQAIRVPSLVAVALLLCSAVALAQRPRSAPQLANRKTRNLREDDA